MKERDVAVVLVCENQGRTLDEALASAECAANEVWVVDQGSQDLFTRQELARLARTHRLIQADGGDLAHGCNLAIGQSTASLIVVASGDAVIDGGYVEAARLALDEWPQGSFICPSILWGQSSALLSGPVDVQPVDLLATGTMPTGLMFRREAWARVGGLRQGALNPWIDFVVSLLREGLLGRWLPSQEAARQRSAPRPQTTERHVHQMADVYATHHDLVAASATNLLFEKEGQLLWERERHESLMARRNDLATELGALNAKIDSTLEAMATLGTGRVDLGDFATTTPISPVWGLDRGIPLDRYYISAFLNRHQQDVRGRVLEVKETTYTRQFGADRVTVSDVIDIDPANHRATITADLCDAPDINDDSFDCFVLTQTLGVIYDVRAALATAHRIIKPGGVLLCTVPASGRISYEDGALDGDYWRFTEASIRRLFAEVFPLDAFEIVGYGNVLAGAAFLYGLSPHELAKADLDVYDPYFPVVYGIRAVKPQSPSS